MTRSIAVLLTILCFASRVFAAACAESPTGQQNCEVFSARDQNALSTPALNYLKVKANNAASLGSLPTPAAGECVVGDSATTSATDTFNVDCKGGTNITAPVTFQNASRTPVGSVDTAGVLTMTGMAIPRPFAQIITTGNIPATPVAVNVVNPIPWATNGAGPISGISFPVPTPTGTPAALDLSKVQIDSAGTYRIFISAIVNLITGQPGHLTIWLAVNGTAVPGSGTKVEVASSGEITLAAEYLQTFTAGQYFQIMYSYDDADVQMLEAAAVPTPGIPLTPAVIVIVSKVSA